MGSSYRPTADRRLSEQGNEDEAIPRRRSEQIRDWNNREVRSQEAAEYKKSLHQLNGRPSIPTGPKGKAAERKFDETRRSSDSPHLSRRSSGENNGAWRDDYSYSRSEFSSPYRRDTDSSIGFRDPPRWEGPDLERGPDERNNSNGGKSSFSNLNNTSRPRIADLPSANKAKKSSDPNTLVTILTEFANFASNQASLQQRYDRAVISKNRITEEYNKSKSAHKDFPTMEESQRAAMDSAKEELEDVVNQLDATKADMSKVIRDLVTEITANKATEDKADQKVLSDRLHRVEANMQERFSFCQVGLDESENRWSVFEKTNESKWDALRQDASLVLRDISALQKAIPIDLKMKMENFQTEISRLPLIRMEQTRLSEELEKLKELVLKSQAAQTSRLLESSDPREDISHMQEEQKAFFKKRETEDSLMLSKLEQLTSRCSALESSLKEFGINHDSDINKLNATIASLQKTQAETHRSSIEDSARTSRSVNTPPMVPSNFPPMVPSVPSNSTNSSALMPAPGSIAPVAPMTSSGSQMQNPVPAGGVDQKIAALQNAVDGVMLDIHHLDVRMNNITTDQVARQMLGQLENAYPNLRRAEDAIQSLSAHTNQQAVNQNDLNLRVVAMEKTVAELSMRVASVETKPVLRQDTGPEVDAVRSEVEKIASEVSELRNATQDVPGVRSQVRDIARDVSNLKQIAQDVSEVKKDKDTLDMTLKNISQDVENSKNDSLNANKIFITRIGKLEDRVDSLDEAVKKTSTDHSSPSHSPSPSPKRDYVNSLKRKFTPSENGSKKQRRVSRAPFGSGSEKSNSRSRHIGGFIDDSD